MTSYERPIKAALYVHLDNGDQFEAGPDDLAKFGYVDRLDAYMRFNERLADTLMSAGLIERHKDLVRAKLNPLRYLAETAICHPSLLDHPEMAATYAEIVTIEQALRVANVPAEEE